MKYKKEDTFEHLAYLVRREKTLQWNHELEFHARYVARFLKLDQKIQIEVKIILPSKIL